MQRSCPFWEAFSAGYERVSDGWVGRWQAQPGGFDRVVSTLHAAGGSFSTWMTQGEHSESDLGNYAILHILTQMASGTPCGNFPQPKRYTLADIELKPYDGIDDELSTFLLRPRRHGAQAFFWLMITQYGKPGHRFVQPKGDERLINVAESVRRTNFLRFSRNDLMPDHVHAAAAGVIIKSKVIVYPMPSHSWGAKIVQADHLWQRMTPADRSYFDAECLIEDTIRLAPRKSNELISTVLKYSK